eukprot:GHVR01087805.1.p1 GENE.GHVR01087805.1~~GHVR01087805.1.p1  ORF type:complete len:208 (-),score=19.76 GHVR01087805.1:27-650(-)
MQVAPTTGFQKRAQYYASKAYSTQLSSGSPYANLKEVIFIAITDCVIFKNTTNYKSHHVLLDEVTHEKLLKDFSFTFLELPKFKKTKIEELETMVEKWCYFFKFASSIKEGDLKELDGSDTSIKQAYNALLRFNWSDAELLAYENEIKRNKDNIAALKYQYDEGRTEGRTEGKTEIAKIMLSQNYTIEQISSVSGISEEILSKMKEN